MALSDAALVTELTIAALLSVATVQRSHTHPALHNVLSHCSMADLTLSSIVGMGKARHTAGANGGGPGELRQSVKVGKLNLVDLAGSERVHVTGATGPPLSAAKY